MPTEISQFLSVLERFKVVDLTHTLENNMPVFPSHTKYFLNHWISPGDPAYLNVMTIGDHAGTHFDTPAHFLHDESNTVRKLCHEIDPMAMIGRAVKLTFGPFLADNSTVSDLDIMAWEAENVELREDDIVIFDYQWAGKWAPVNESNAFMEAWPGLSESAVDYLIDKKVRVVGTDCASVDSADGDGGKFPGHLGLLFTGILVIENLMNLDSLPAEFIFIGLPLKIKDAGGSPIRALALVANEK